MTETSDAPARELGGGDHDQPYRCGSPKAQLTTRELARLLVLRGRLAAARDQAINHERSYC